MRLIQFAGPIRPEWYQALVATGARIVTYIPNNAYLVYGSVADPAGGAAVGFQQLDRAMGWRVHRRVSPRSGDHAIAKDSVPPERTGRLRNANLSAKGNEQFTIQMVEDPAENATTLALIEQFKLEPIIKQDSMLGYFNVRVALPRDVVIKQIAERGDVVSIQQWVTPKKRTSGRTSS